VTRGQTCSHQIWVWREFWYECGGRLSWCWSHYYLGIVSHFWNDFFWPVGLYY
jgi:hypothetical protein